MGTELKENPWQEIAGNMKGGFVEYIIVHVLFSRVITLA